jgi:cytochrome P450
MTPDAHDTSAQEFHPFRWDDAEDPFEALAEIRHACPVTAVHFAPLPDAKLVTRYDDLATIFRDSHTFNNIGISIDVDAHSAIPPENQGIISSNPPFHGPKRRLMLNAVAPAPVDRAIAKVRALADEVVGRFAVRETAELVTEWANPIPSGSVALVLGLPVEDCQRHGEWTTQIILGAARMSPSHAEFGRVPSMAAYGPGEGTSPFAYLMEHLEKRRNGESIDEEDGMTAMLAATHPRTGEHYSDMEIIEAVNTMLAAGNETTTSLMGNPRLAARATPEVYAAIRDDRSLVRAAIDESLRLDPPQQIFRARVHARH